jgi:hypothetical protein
MTSSTLDEQLEVRSAEAWYPWKSDGAGQPEKIAGEVAAIDSVYSDYQAELRLIVVIREESGRAWNVRTYPTRLHEEWLRLQPQIGEKVALKFCGMVARKQDGKSYPDFALAVEREQPEKFDYARMGAAEPDDGPEPEHEQVRAPEREPVHPSNGNDDGALVSVGGGDAEDIPF